jgi:hypothetical protein
MLKVVQEIQRDYPEHENGDIFQNAMTGRL